MALYQFHRFLIVTFLVFLAYFAFHTTRLWLATEAVSQLLTAIGCLAAIVGFGFYLRTVNRLVARLSKS